MYSKSTSKSIHLRINTYKYYLLSSIIYQTKLLTGGKLLLTHQPVG
jgi:hypothetical protein